MPHPSCVEILPDIKERDLVRDRKNVLMHPYNMQFYYLNKNEQTQSIWSSSSSYCPGIAGLRVATRCLVVVSAAVITPSLSADLRPLIPRK